MLLNRNELTMKTIHTPTISKSITGEDIKGEPVELDCFVMNNLSTYKQNDGSYIKLEQKSYILADDSNVKVGDYLDGLLVNEILTINDFSGEIIHFEAKVAKG